MFAEPNLTQPYQLFTYANDVTQHAFGIVIIAVMAIIIFMAVKQNFKTSQAALTASFIATIFAMLFRTIDLVGDQVWLWLSAFTVICFAWLWFEDRWG
jgi:hypothetical protein